MYEKLKYATADDATATEGADETDKNEDDTIEFEGSLTSPYCSTNEFSRLANEIDDALNIIAELERRVDEHETHVQRESVELVLYALSHDMAMEVLDCEIVLVAKGIIFSRDKITSLIRESLLAGCLDSIDDSTCTYAKSEIRRESGPGSNFCAFICIAVSSSGLTL